MSGRWSGFLRSEAGGGALLCASAVLALVAANTGLADLYARLLETPLSIRVGSAGLDKPLLLWINDGLMAVFFLLVGCELKREILGGHLASLRAAALPLVAALGGMAVPALIYLALNRHDPLARNGWAIPTATDIAFALGVLALLGPRVPGALRAFLLGVAIFDDLGAILVIAFFYTAELSATALAVTLACLAALVALNRLGIRHLGPYVLVGLVLWVAVLKSGVHATIAGVLVALCVPLRGGTDGEEPPLLVLEHALAGWVKYLVLPVFGFANAGVPLAGLAPAAALHPVPLGIAAGLFAGKQLGVLGFAWLAVRLRLATLAEELRPPLLYGAALLCGIGFTMSLFIASLAFEQGSAPYLGLERLGILAGSLVSALA
ncbi:MAG: Na+/H+ antiporter NhaA, partial [Planctomycetes bacterium]|nr:Na+/H+ antiporter NhaA [Planctomycetota bacterium]